MESLYRLQKILDISVARNGSETLLTIGHLNNIVKLAISKAETEMDEIRKDWDEFETEQHQWGNS